MEPGSPAAGIDLSTLAERTIDLWKRHRSAPVAGGKEGSYMKADQPDRLGTEARAELRAHGVSLRKLEGGPRTGRVAGHMMIDHLKRAALVELGRRPGEGALSPAATLQRELGIRGSIVELLDRIDPMEAFAACRDHVYQAKQPGSLPKGRPERKPVAITVVKRRI